MDAAATQSSQEEPSLHKLAEAGDLVTIQRVWESYGRAKMNDVDERRMTPLMHAAKHNRLETVKFLLKEKAALNQKNNVGDTALILAASQGHLPVVKELLNHGAQLNERNNKRWTALMKAIYHNKAEVAIELIDRNADVTLVGLKQNAASLAVRENQVSVIVRMLEDYSLPVLALDDSSASPFLWQAFEHRNEEMFSLLVSHGAELFQVFRGETLLHQLAKSGPRHESVSEHVLNHFKSQDAPRVTELVNLRNSAGKTALMLACEHDFLLAIEQLLALGADHSMQDNNGATATLHCVSLNSIRVLFSNSANLHCKDNSGSTVLHRILTVIPDDTAELIQFLLQEKIDVNAADSAGVTPLLLASDLSCRIVNLLLQARANPAVRANDGRTPFKNAQRADIALLLLEHGAGYKDPWEPSYDSKQDILSLSMDERIPVLEIAKECDIDKLQQSISNGADLDARDKFGNGVLHYAVAFQCRPPDALAGFARFVLVYKLAHSTDNHRRTHKVDNHDGVDGDDDDDDDGDDDNVYCRDQLSGFVLNKRNELFYDLASDQAIKNKLIDELKTVLSLLTSSQTDESKEPVRPKRKLLFDSDGDDEAEASTSSVSPPDDVESDNDDEVGDEQEEEQLMLAPSSEATPSISVPESRSFTTQLFYPQQMLVADKLLNSILQRVGSLSKFRRIEVQVMVPAKDSIFFQTQKRLQSALSVLPNVHFSIFKAMMNVSSHRSEFDTFLAKIKEERDTFFLFIHDEAHWGATEKASAVDGNSQGSSVSMQATDDDGIGSAGQVLNRQELKDLPNFAQLLVSATPYNLVTQNTRIPSNNIVEWVPGDVLKSPGELWYYGISEFRRKSTENYYEIENLGKLFPGALHFDSQFEDTLKSFKPDESAFNTWLTSVYVNKIARKDQRKLRTIFLLETLFVEAIQKLATTTSGSSDQSGADGGNNSGGDVAPMDLSSGSSSSKPAEPVSPRKRSSAILTVLKEPLSRGESVSPDDVSMTTRMVKDLLATDASGRGIMILVRVTEVKFGIVLHKALVEARNKAGFANQFAVICDLDVERNAQGNIVTRRKALVDCMEPAFLESLRVFKSNPDFVPKSYDDLNGLPCFLILCQKGRLGDTFPKSLKYYDLRFRQEAVLVRSTMEQDLGRGCRYVCDEDLNLLPHILLRREMFDKLVAKKDAERAKDPLFQMSPDNHCRIVKGEEGMFRRAIESNLTNEGISLSLYRQFYLPEKHYDLSNVTKELWSRRFLLYARPQIGKTGAYLSLVHKMSLLLEMQESIETIVAGDDDDDDPEPDASSLEASLSDEHPNPEHVQKMSFRYKFHEGKYAAPPVVSPAPSIASAASGASASLLGVAPDLGSDVVPLVFPDSPADHVFRGFPCYHALSCPSCLPTLKEPASNLIFFVSTTLQPVLKQEEDIGHGMFFVVPQQHPRISCFVDRGPCLLGLAFLRQKQVWENFGVSYTSNETQQVKYLRNLALDDCDILHPIFIPSYKRAFAAHLNHAHNMVKTVSESGVQESATYLQIVVVRRSEYSEYKKNWPNQIFFVLPDCPENTAHGLPKYVSGIGFARHCIQLAAEALALPFVWMLDDNCKSFKYIPLKSEKIALDAGNAPDSLFKLTLPGCDGAAKGKQQLRLIHQIHYSNLSDESRNKAWTIPMSFVLLHVQCDPRLAAFAVCGFKRPFIRFQVSSIGGFSRRHVYAAVLLNIGGIQQAQVSYKPSLTFQEDIYLNEELSKKDKLVVKYNRFLLLKSRMDGGCAWDQPVPLPAEPQAVEPFPERPLRAKRPHDDDDADATDAPPTAAAAAAAAAVGATETTRVDVKEEKFDSTSANAAKRPRLDSFELVGHPTLRLHRHVQSVQEDDLPRVLDLEIPQLNPSHWLSVRLFVTESLFNSCCIELRGSLGSGLVLSGWKHDASANVFWTQSATSAVTTARAIRMFVHKLPGSGRLESGSWISVELLEEQHVF